MDAFPRTTVGGVSLPRMIIGTNWFRGFSHTSLAKDRFIKSYQSPDNVAEILTVFLEAGIDALMGGDLSGPMAEAVEKAEQRTGKQLIRILTPHFNIRPGGQPEMEPERVFETCRKLGATFCFPHQQVTDSLIDRRDRIIRDIDTYTSMIRSFEMIPGISTHMPEAVKYADGQGADLEGYVQIYNAAGFLMQLEADWVMKIINEAKKPVLTIKPLAAGRLMPVVGLSFVWSTIRDCDMVVVGTTTPDEAREVIDISVDLLNRRVPQLELQTTRSKSLLEARK